MTMNLLSKTDVALSAIAVLKDNIMRAAIAFRDAWFNEELGRDRLREALKNEPWMIRGLLKLAENSLCEEAFRMQMRNTAFRVLGKYKIETQKALIENGHVEVCIVDETNPDKTNMLMMPLEAMTAEQIRLAFGDDGPRPLEEQRALIEAKRMKRFSCRRISWKKISPTEVMVMGKGRLDIECLKELCLSLHYVPR